MRTDLGKGSGGTRSRPWQVLALLLTVLAIASGATGWLLQDDAGRPAIVDGPPSVTSSVRAGQQVSRPRRDPRPIGLSIPDIGVSTRLVSLGLNADQTVEVPSDPAAAGWYRLGPAPGSPGSAVILGHVDSTTGPAVFYHLRTLAPGARIDVERADGSVLRFAVRRIATYANEDFPASRVYRNRGAPTLTLVTCGGVYDKAKGGYQANLVVSAAYLGRVLDED